MDCTVFHFNDFINSFRKVLWAIIMIVLSPLILFIAFVTSFSVILSSALVASSKINISGLLYNALAIPILCL